MSYHKNKVYADYNENCEDEVVKTMATSMSSENTTHEYTSSELSLYSLQVTQ